MCLTSRRRPDATPRTDESLPPDESRGDSSDERNEHCVGQVSRSRGATVRPARRVVDSSYTRPKIATLARASEAARDESNQHPTLTRDACWTWLIRRLYALCDGGWERGLEVSAGAAAGG